MIEIWNMKYDVRIAYGQSLKRYFQQFTRIVVIANMNRDTDNKNYSCDNILILIRDFNL